MGKSSAAAHPECVLVQFFGHALGFERIFVCIERLEHLQCRFYKSAIGEYTSIAGQAGIGVNRDQRMNRIIGPYLGGPAPFRTLAHKRRSNDGAYG